MRLVWQRVPLAWRLALAVGGVLAVTLAGAFWAVDRTMAQRLRAGVDDGLQTQIREWRRSITGVGLDTPARVEAAARVWLAQQRDHPSSQIQVVDVAGGPQLTNHPGLLGVEVAHEQAEEADPTLRARNDVPIGGLLDSGPGLRTANSVDLGLVRVVTEPITFHGRVVGTVRVADSLVPVARTQAQLRRTFGVVAGLAALLAALATAGLSGLATRPLRRLATLAASVDAGELDRRAGPLGSGEIATLAGAFDRMLDRLQAAFARQRQFVGDASHELRTPLAVLQAQVDLLKGEPDEVARREGLEVLASRLGQLDRLVGDLLTLARAGADRLHEPRPLDVADFFEDLRRDLPLFGPRTYTVQACGGTLIADPDRLTQVLRNLVRNAVNNTDPDGEITVTARPQDDRLLVTVTDRGTGIPEDQLPQIFERFHRTDTGRQRDRGGSGLGLPIARALVEAHGGRIRASSRPGEGSTFLVELPGFTPEDPPQNPRAEPRAHTEPRVQSPVTRRR
jgi:two-component system OmpR family sensor kinase